MSVDLNKHTAEQSVLSEDRFDALLHDRLLAGDDQDSTEHLHSEDALDADSMADLALMRQVLGSYKSEALRFAAKQSASMPTPRVSRAAALWDSTPRWAVAATAAVALACTTVVVTERANEPAPVAMAAPPTTQALQADNRLLLSVDQALSNSVAPSEEELGLTAVPAHTVQHRRTAN